MDLPPLGALLEFKLELVALVSYFLELQQQKKKYLPKLISGEWISAYGLTEPSSGSDALSAKTTAVLSEDGKHYVLNGEKQFISNGGWADVYTILAQVDGNKFSGFIVNRDIEGFSVGHEEKNGYERLFDHIAKIYKR